jgi:uncharacterized damage-inducible protein DinB
MMESEIQGYLTEFNIIREDISKVVRGLDDEAANWQPLQSDTNSIYAILTHIMGVDNFWVRQVIGGQTVQRNREAEFRASGKIAELLPVWEVTWIEIKSMLGKLDHKQLSEVRSRPFSSQQKESITVQWVILHLITHYATHLGHVQLTRQLWECRLIEKKQ